jgi:hypothetical protein
MANKLNIDGMTMHVIDGLYIGIEGKKYKLKTPLLSGIQDADPERPVAIIRQHDFNYSEAWVGYIWKTENVEGNVVAYRIFLGTTKKQEGSFTSFVTTDIIGWCYLDEPVK